MTRQRATSERRSEILLAHIRDSICVTDPQGIFLYDLHAVSDVESPRGRSESDLINVDQIHPDDIATALAAWQQATAHPGEEATAEVRVAASDGGWDDIIITVLNMLEDASIGGFVVTSRRITGLRRAQRLASHQASVLELIAFGQPLAVVAEACVELVEANGIGGSSSIYLLEDNCLRALAGRAPQAINDWVGEPIRDRARSICDSALIDGTACIVGDFETAEVSSDLRALATDEGIEAGWSLPIVSTSTGLPVGSLSNLYPRPHEPTHHELRVGEVACSLMAIALERTENANQLAHQASHDGLTGLPNRTRLMERLEQALALRRANGSDVALLFCDIDRFKVVNDSLGHGIGDQLLVAFGERFRHALDPQHLLARFGGDEFIVLISEVADDEHPERVARDLAATLERPFLLPAGPEVYLTCSIGIATASDHDDGDAWLRDADAAMYRAKDEGRDRTALFDVGMRSAAHARLEVENHLRRAVELNELVIHYQPLVHLATGRVSGVEALVRWQHPDRGLLAPDDFIGVAEDIGVINQVGRFVLETAIAEISREVLPHTEGFGLSVNVSAHQLSTTSLAETVEVTCARHGWPPGRLQLEITESAILEGLAGPAHQLARIHELGVALAIDDFGTGYSSLTRLGLIPVNQIKIDQTFVAMIEQTSESRARIVDAVVAMAGALDLETTAEGVETAAQLAYLREIGCSYAQGYLFSKPLAIEELGAFLEAEPTW